MRAADASAASPASLATYLTALAASLPRTLVSEESWRSLQEVALALPVATGGLERLLGGGPATVDLAVCFGRQDPALRRMIELMSGSIEPGVRAFLAAAAEPDSVLQGRADRIWLEMDVSVGGRLPSLYFQPAEPLSEVIDVAALLVLGHPLPAPQRRWLESLLPLPPATSLSQVGWMLGRPAPPEGPRPLRSCFEAAHRPALEALVERTCGREALEGVRTVLDRFGAAATRFALMLSVQEDRVAPRIGLELTFAGSRRLTPLRAWAALLAQLVAAGLCTPVEREALLSWPGTSVETDDPTCWPPNLAGWQVLVAPYQPCLWRGLDHVKLVMTTDGQVIAAKCYFGWLQGWIRA
jgi:hypothetical protein